MIITKKNKSTFKKLGIFATREQLITQVLKQVHYPISTNEIVEYLSEIKGRPYTISNISSAISSLKKDKIIIPIATKERLPNNTFAVKYILAR